MSNIKVWAKNLWKIVGSGNATGISTNNASLLEDGEENISVYTALERLAEWKDKSKAYIAWLAKNGGGGNGGTGSGGSSITEAECTIYVAGQDGQLVSSGGNIILGNSGITIKFDNINIKLNKKWEVSIRVGSSLFAIKSASYTQNTIYISKEDIESYLENHTGTFSIRASYNDDTNAIYGSSEWDGTIIESVVDITCEDTSTTIDGETSNISNKTIDFTYSVGYLGDTSEANYRFTVDVYKNGELKNTYSEDLLIKNRNKTTKTLSLLQNLFDGVSENAIGVYTIVSTLTSITNSAITSSCESNLTVASDNIMVASTVMKEWKEDNTESGYYPQAQTSGSYMLDFTAYVNGSTSFYYYVTIGETEVISNAVGTFGIKTQQSISLTNKSWVQEGTINKVTLEIYTSSDRNGKSATVYYGVEFIKAVKSLLTERESKLNKLISEMTARNFNARDNSFNFINEKYSDGSSLINLSSSIIPINGNALSVIHNNGTNAPYLRLSNGAAVKNCNWIYNSNTHDFNQIFPESPSAVKQLTISCCFKADYHADDYRTILFCGTINSDTYEMVSGISIDVHDVYINGNSVCKLTDNTINIVDIVIQQVEGKKPDGNGEIIPIISYITKVYVDGVMTAVKEMNGFPFPLNTNVVKDIYLGCRATSTGELCYMCDCNIYNYKVYDTALSDYDIMINYINNLAITKYYKNGQPGYDNIQEELKKNFCEVDANNNVTSLIYNVEADKYALSSLTMETSNGVTFNKTLEERAAAIGIPMMIIDVSSDPKWTFASFSNQQLYGDAVLDKSENKKIIYWDPSASNSSILEFTGDIELQGHSTLSDFVKNINITLPDNIIFIPNKTWYPEKTYTLKADVVDSSHSNNAAIGTFINEVLGPDSKGEGSILPFSQTAIENVYNSDYKKHQQKDVTLKHTVTGFPILLLMKFYVDSTSTVDITPLGIYSFNLGRDAYRNLGFKKVKSITFNDKADPKVEVFPYLSTDAVITEEECDADWIEIANTSAMDITNLTDNIPSEFDSSLGDFWQNEDNILNSRFEVRYPANTLVSQRKKFKDTFVRGIMELPIEGCAKSNDLGAYSIPQITGTYDTYKCDTDGTNYEITGKCTMYSDPNHFNGEEMGFNPRSFYVYYDIAMLFGLIDNFGKNSTYRSWEGGDYYIDFYDLDSANGGSNQGELNIGIDTWLKYLYNKKDGTEDYGYVSETFDPDLALQSTKESKVSANQNKLWLSLDTPTARNVFSDNHNGNSRYADYWADLMVSLTSKANAAGYTWKKEKPINPIVEWFMTDYFEAQTKNCGPLLFNLDYKLKYLMQFTADTYENMSALPKLHGRKLAYTKNWLNKHIQFLDSVFNWRGNIVMNYSNNVNTTANNTVLNTGKNFPIRMNTPLIFRSSIGDTTKAFYFAPQNKYITTRGGNNQQNAVTWIISNSPNIINLGNDDIKLSSMSVQTMKASNAQNTLDYGGFPSITSLNLSDNTAFSSNFNLDAFTKGAISEIRELDFSNTKSSDGKKFDINLTYSEEGDTHFTKLTKVNISNSQCVNQINIPRIPLQELLLTGSSITNFILKKQAYLEDVNLTGCTNLRNIVLSECSKYKKLSLSNLTQLNSVNISLCDSFEELMLDNCKALTSVSIENCKSLKKITIKNCVNLIGTNNNLTISGCKNLVYLDLSGCTSLSTFVIRDSNQNNITTLNLSSTLVKYITENTTDTDRLNIKEWTSLNSFNIQNNNAVEIIQMANIQNNAIPLNNSFSNCNNLKRIYGHISVGISGMFKNCNNFSVHGTDLNSVKYNNQPILSNGRVKMPWEFVDANNPNNFSKVAFMSGIEVTNMDFATTSLSETFRGTACSTFDIYYILSNCPNVTNMNYAFYGLKVSPFNWTESVDNSPNRYMFKWCNRVTTMYEMFYGNGGTIRLFTPTIENETIIDNGLFSPLIDTLTNTGRIFWNFTIISNRYLFRHSSKDYRINTLNYFNINTLYNNSNTCGRGDITMSSSTIESFGDFTDFYKQLPLLTSFHYMMSNVSFINYDTLKDINAKYLTQSFKSLYGKGDIIPSQIFVNNGSNVVSIRSSFTIDNAYNSIVANMPITDNTFKDFKSLKVLGYGGDNIDVGPLSSCFTGNGINKYINQQEFPYNIIPNTVKSKITTFTGLFMNCNTGNMTEEPCIPGDMFKGCTALTDISAMFYNVNFVYTLEGEKMKDCNNLQKVIYMFASESNRQNYLKGQIPLKLFYHGHIVINKTVKGILYAENNSVTIDPDNSKHWTIVKNNNTYHLNINNDIPQWTDAYENIINENDVLDSKTITYNSMKATITDMTGCFMGVNTSAFSCEPNVENNENYMPFIAIYINNKFTNVVTNNYETTGIWCWDGNYDSHRYPLYAENYDVSNEIEASTYYDSVKVESQGCTKNFICAPDLLRYSAQNCKVTYLFAYAGHNVPSGSWGNSFSRDSYGIHGRIPPYLLYPLRNNEGVDISYMFYNCKQVSYYTIGETSYIIPEKFFDYCSNIQAMNYTFSGMNFPQNINLNVFGSIPSNKLKEVVGAFYMPYFYGNSPDNKTNVNSVFNTHTGISKASRCFAATYDKNNQSVKRTKQYVKFCNVFPSSFASSKINNMEFSEVFAYYSSGYVEHESQKTLPNNVTLNNYAYYG